MFKKLLSILTNKNFDIFINTIFICPFLYIIEYDWEKYKIIALLLSVFILIKNIIIININYFINKNKKNKSNLINNNFSFILIYSFFKMLIKILFFYIQYKYKFFVKFNTWICGIIYFKYFIILFKKIFNLNVNIIKNK